MVLGALALAGDVGRWMGPGGTPSTQPIGAGYTSRGAHRRRLPRAAPGPLLTLAIDDPEWRANKHLPGAALLPDHGKLMHMFLVAADDLSAFAHVHPVPAGEDAFTVPLPPLPAGEYRIFADIVHENGFAPTLVDTVRVPASAAEVSQPAEPAPNAPPSAGQTRDPDDSWARLQPRGASTSLEYALPSGRTLRWERDGAVVADAETTLRFAATEPDGSPAVLEPYMGMLSHAAVMRHDASVFVHLHPRVQHQPHGTAALRGGGRGNRPVGAGGCEPRADARTGRTGPAASRFPSSFRNRAPGGSSFR